MDTTVCTISLGSFFRATLQYIEEEYILGLRSQHAIYLSESSILVARKWDLSLLPFEINCDAAFKIYYSKIKFNDVQYIVNVTTCIGVD